MALQATQKSPGLTGSPGHPGLDKGKKAVYQNRSWVRGRDPEPVDDSPDGSETGRPSLLSRLESPSLLKRIAPPAEAAAASSLAARLKNPPASIDTGVSEDYDEDVDMRDAEASTPNGVQVKMEEIVAALPSPTRERRGWKTRGARPTIDVFGEPTGPVTASGPQDIYEDPTEEDEDSSTPEPDPMPVSDTVVDAFLVDIAAMAKFPATTPPRVPPVLQPPQSKETLSTSDGDVDMTHDHLVSTDAAPPPPPSTPLPKSVLEKCRELLMPTIFQYAKRRDPALNEHVAKQRILARLSDDRCSEFVQLAKQMQMELKAQGGREPSRDVSVSGTVSVSKRPLEEADNEGQPAPKLPRTDAPEEMNVGGGDVQTTRGTRPSTPRRDHDHLASISEGESSTANPASGLHPEPLRAISPRRSDTPMSVPATPSASTPVSRYPDSLPAVVPPKEHRVSGSGDPGLLITRSPVTSEPPFSAEASLRSATISHSPTPSTPVQDSRSPPPAETLATFRSLSLNPSHHETDPVTDPSPVNTKDPPVAQDATQGADQDPMQEKEDASIHPLESEASTLVPAVWHAVEGRPSAGVETSEFFVDNPTAKAARNWALREELFRFEHRHVRVHLLCLPKASVEEVYQTLPPDASRAEIVAALWNIETDWPLKGTLVVQADADCAINTWMPDPHSGPLDITAAIRHGQNSFKLIQLADMSSKLFVFHAAEPSDEERKAASLWRRSVSIIAPQSPRPQDRH